MIKLLIFDLDGTLVDAFKAVTTSVHHVMDEVGLERPTHRSIKNAVGWGEGDLLMRFVGEHHHERALRLFRRHHKKALISGGARFLPGVSTLLRYAHQQGYMLAIASNRPTVYTRLILKGLGILPLFKEVVCADRVERAKPHPDMLHVILERQQLHSDQTMFVGDMVVDVQAGERAGIRTVAVTTGVNTYEQLQEVGASTIISRMSELKPIIEGVT